MKILIIAGTRPEAIKVAPVVHRLRAEQGVSVLLASSGQHREMLAQALADFNLVADHDLSVMREGQDLAGLTARLIESIDTLLSRTQPDWVLVQGDTTTVMAAATCAFYRKIKLGHIEAGLRSARLDAPFPEEFNRRIASLAATMHFAPTEHARVNLLREGVADERILVTGNTCIDALLWTLNRKDATIALLPPATRKLITEKRKLILVTGHRRENHGRGLEDLCNAMLHLTKAHDIQFVYPVHLNPAVQKTVYGMLGGHERIHLLPPLPYKTFAVLMANSHIILTDSGGVQEEASALNVPVLVFREVTERPEGIEAGTSRLAGTDWRSISQAVKTLLTVPTEYSRMKNAASPYGDGQAAARIAQALFTAKP